MMLHFMIMSLAMRHDVTFHDHVTGYDGMMLHFLIMSLAMTARCYIS